jgi:uncharacterized protein (TIGR03083 family)
MTTESLADRTIAALRAEHDSLAATARVLSDQELRLTSGATDWSVAQVLSHLGSGSEILLGVIARARGTSTTKERPSASSVWARWDALTPIRQRDEFLVREEELVALFESLDGAERSTLRIDVGFQPEPQSLTAFAGLRLYELALHSWDARVAAAPAAELTTETATVLAEHLAGDIGVLVGMIGRAERVGRTVRLDVGSGYQLRVDDAAALVATTTGDLLTESRPTGTFDGPLEAVLRLIGGRLGLAHTPPDVSVTGDTTLEELRTVFTGF